MSKRSRVGYTITDATVRKNVKTELNGKLYEVIDTVIPGVIIRQLRFIWEESDRIRREKSGSYVFIVERSSNREITGIRWGLDKNTILGERGQVILKPNTISYHTHPGSSRSNKDRLFTLPSGADLRVYISNYPTNQINLILDRQGIVVLDIDLEETVKKIMERGMDVAAYAAYVQADYDQWYTTISKNPGWELVGDMDNYSYVTINNRADKSLVVNKLKQYGINSKFISWDVESIPVSLDNIMTTEGERGTIYFETTNNSNSKSRSKGRKSKLNVTQYWYYFKNNRFVGPYTSQKLLQKYSENKINDNTLVREGLDEEPKQFRVYRKRILDSVKITSLQLKRIFDKHKNVLENINNNRLLNIWDNYDQYYEGLRMEDRPDSNNMSRAKLEEFRNAMNKILFSENN